MSNIRTRKRERQNIEQGMSNFEGLGRRGFIGFDLILGRGKRMFNFQCSMTNFQKRVKL